MRGEAQCRSLGLDVQAWDQGASTSASGELVCVNPFPSRPLGFFGDADGTRFHAAYFAANPGVWTHGDIIEFTPQGSARLHGRSDGVLDRARHQRRSGRDLPHPRRHRRDPQAMVVQQAADDARGAVQRVVLLLVLRRGVQLDGRARSRGATRTHAARLGGARAGRDHRGRLRCRSRTTASLRKLPRAMR